MEKNFFDKMSDSYENFHLKESEINTGKGTLHISPKLKLILGWSLFILLCVLTFIFGGFSDKKKDISKEEKEAVLGEKVDVDEEHETLLPYEKDSDKELNAFIEKYFKAITDCDHETLQDMVIEPSVYKNNEALKKKAEFITGYDNITIYTKAGFDEGSYIAFVVANVTIAGVNSAPYDIISLYIVNGERGYMINNGKLSKDADNYIEKVKGDKDIQKIYKSVEKKNKEYKEKDPTLKEFYEIINRKDVKTNSAADKKDKQSKKK